MTSNNSSTFAVDEGMIMIRRLTLLGRPNKSELENVAENIEEYLGSAPMRIVREKCSNKKY